MHLMRFFAKSPKATDLPQEIPEVTATFNMPNNRGEKLKQLALGSRKVLAKRVGNPNWEKLNTG
jgi:hypothetical protein